ncbi:MAG: BatD family protein [Candidatus Thiodiazotropha sp.]
MHGHILLNAMLPTKPPLTSRLNVLLIILLLLLSSSVEAKVAARLSSNATGLDQPVRLTLQSEGEQEMTPDLSGLERLFEIVGRSTQQSISIINGKMSAKRSLTLTQLPRQTGSLEIPPIRSGNASTAALVLEVAERSQDDTEANGEQVLVELSLNKSRAYIEEEVILTLKLFQAPGIRAESLDTPQPSLPDTQLKLLHEERYPSELDGIQFNVIERKYAVFAYQSGNLKIGGVKYRGRTAANRLFSFLNDPFSVPQQEARIFRSESNQVELEVMPIPDSFTGDRWLPAKNLQIVESGLGQQTPILAGKPLVRRIMVLADGLTSAQLPNIEQTLPSGIKLYEERPQLKETPTRTGIGSSRQINMTLIATEPGQYDLPAIEIPWWNTETNHQESASLAAVSLNITPNPGSATGLHQQQQTLQSKRDKAVQDDTGEANTTDYQPAAAATAHRVHWLVWLFATAWILTLLAWWYSRRDDPDQPRQSIPAAEDEKDEPGKRAIAKALQRLEQAYADSDAPAARTAWLAWAKLQWPETPPQNLTRLAARCDRAVSEAVRSLERTLYSPTEETGWTAYEIRQLIQQMQQERSSDKHPEGLVPLNP